jgi:hypothetical protein
MLEVVDDVPGASELIAWFGCWPSFHDAEVLDCELHRAGDSTIRIHTWETTDEVSGQGFFVCKKHVIVSFVLEQVTNLQLSHFNAQNVISGLMLKQTDDGYVLTLEGCYGIEGMIAADRVRVKLQAGIPAESQYSKMTGE